MCGKFLRCGENILQFKNRISAAHPGLESVFLLGNFGVKRGTDRIELTSPVTSLVSEDWCMQGLPFYAGKVTYHTRVSLAKACRGKIRLTGFEGTSAHIFVDGVCGACGEKDPNSSDEPEVMLGDMNGDGKVNAIDANVMKRIMSGNITPTKAQALAGDLTGDGVVNGMDSNMLARLLSGGN